jgi:hypothetical protein
LLVLTGSLAGGCSGNTTERKTSTGQNPSSTAGNPEGRAEGAATVAVISNYMRQKGMDPNAYAFSVVRQSTIDPNWKTDQAERVGAAGTFYFILKKVGPNWTVVSAGDALTPQQIKKDGAPGDLWQSVPTGYPKDQITEIRGFLAAHGVDASDLSIGAVDASPSDPAWQLFATQQSAGQPVLFVLHLENGVWVVKNYGSALTDTPGMPPDLLNP